MPDPDMPAHDRLKAVEHSGHQLLLLPARAGGERQKLLYLLDGNAAMAAIRPEWLAQRPDLAIVGIGYPRTVDFDVDRRSLDYTPPPPPGWDGGSRRATQRPHGGAAAFLERLTRQIMPFAEDRLGLAAPSRTLWGHSYGGLFCLYALTQGIAGLEALHAASPSLWWGDGFLEREIRSVETSNGIGRLWLSMGDGEISRTGEIMGTPQRLADIAQALRHLPELRCMVEIFPGASHRAALARSLEHVVRSC